MSKRGYRAGIGGSVSRGYVVILKRNDELGDHETEHPTLYAAKQQAFALAQLHGVEIPDVERHVLDHYHGVLVVDATEFYKPIDEIRKEAGL